jgi:hypothetical protein
VPGEIWDATADHYDEEQLAAIVLMIAVTNLLNRLNATTRQVAGRVSASAALSGCLCPIWVTHRRAVRRQYGVTFRCP